MKLTDKEFRDQYKPLQVPAHYAGAVSKEQKIIFALAQIGKGTADDVTAELEKLESGVAIWPGQEIKTILTGLFQQGHLSGSDHNGVLHFNLSKITAETAEVLIPKNWRPAWTKITLSG